MKRRDPNALPHYYPWDEQLFMSDVNVQYLSHGGRRIARTLCMRALWSDTRPYLPDNDEKLYRLGDCESLEEWLRYAKEVRTIFHAFERDGARLLEWPPTTQVWVNLGEVRAKKAVAGRKGGLAKAGTATLLPDEPLPSGGSSLAQLSNGKQMLAGANHQTADDKHGLASYSSSSSSSSSSSLSDSESKSISNSESLPSSSSFHTAARTERMTMSDTPEKNHSQSRANDLKFIDSLSEKFDATNEGYAFGGLKFSRKLSAAFGSHSHETIAEAFEHWQHAGHDWDKVEYPAALFAEDLDSYVLMIPREREKRAQEMASHDEYVNQKGLKCSCPRHVAAVDAAIEVSA